MAEVFGIVAGAVGALDVGGRVLSKLNNLRRTWKNAPQGILDLQNQITDVNLTLSRTRDACSAADGADKHGEFSVTMERLLCTVERLLRDLEEVLSDTNAPNSNAKRRYEWVRRQKLILARSAELAEARKGIWELLQSHGLVMGARIRVEVTAIQTALRQSDGLFREGLRVLNQGHEGLERSVRELSNQTHEMRAALEVAMHQRLLDAGASDHNGSSPRLLGYLGSEDKPHQYQQPEETAEPAQAGASTFSHRLGQANTFSVWTAYRDTSCPGPCDCSCHYTPSHRTSWKTPRFLQGLFGTLFASSSALPIIAKACDFASCRRRDAAIYEFRYEFPLWLLAWGIRGLVQRRAEGSLQVTFLRFRPRVSFQHEDVFWFAHFGNMTAVADTLRSDPSKIHCVDEDGDSLLHVFMQSRDDKRVESFDVFFRAGADLYLENDKGFTPVQAVARQILLDRLDPESLAFLSSIIPMTRIIHEIDLSPVSEIILGLRCGDVGSALNSLGPFDQGIDEFDKAGMLPIHWAAGVGNITALEQLVQHGVDINARSAKGHTPLMVGIIEGVATLDAIRWMIDHGADIHAVDYQRNYVFNLACGNGRAGIVRVLVEEYHFDVNYVDGEGLTGLHIASSWGHDDIVAFLLSMGADVNAASDDGRTALLSGINSSAHRCCQMLLDAGADVTRTMLTSTSVLHIAARLADEPTMRILAQYASSGLDTQAEDDWGGKAEDLFRDRIVKTETLEVAFNDLLKAFENASEASFTSDQEAISAPQSESEELGQDDGKCKT